MKLYAFSDFHLSGDPPYKPMDIFGKNWKNHRERIFSAWSETIHPDDAVVMAGDLSWAMNLNDALPDLMAVAALPGRKIIVRGNHDYWWSTVKKMTEATGCAFEFLHNAAIDIESAALGGTRGWLPETSANFTDNDAVILKREEHRLDYSLTEAEKMGRESIIAVLHYPPFDDQHRPTRMLAIMQKHHVSDCIYGHIHDASNFVDLPQMLGGIRMHLTSADYLDFRPCLIKDTLIQ